MENRSVSIRVRDSTGAQAVLPLDEAIKKLVALRESRNIVNEI
jgi:hypothetical protein